jgi:hypothetical protein
MPIANIIDKRKKSIYLVEIDAIFEPSAHDATEKNLSETTPFPSDDIDFNYHQIYKTTIEKAIKFAEKWECAVTLYLYDYGSNPNGPEY